MRRFALLLLVACGPHDVVSVDGDRPPMMGAACNDSSDCTQPDAFCERHDCTSTTGFCAPRHLCMPVGGAVCGCDSVTYSTDCARRNAGVSGSVAGACQ